MILFILICVGCLVLFLIKEKLWKSLSQKEMLRCAERDAARPQLAMAELQAQLDSILQYVDTAFYAGKFNEVNQKLKEIDENKESLDSLICWMCATLPAKSKLPDRPAFMKRVKRRYWYRSNDLWSGLK